MKAPKFIDNKTNKMIDEVKEYAKKDSKISEEDVEYMVATNLDDVLNQINKSYY